MNGWGALGIIWVDEEVSGDDWLIQMAPAGDLVVDFVGEEAEAHNMLKRFPPVHTWVILELHLVDTWEILAHFFHSTSLPRSTVRHISCRATETGNIQ